MKVVVIDNQDVLTYSLVEEFEKRECEVLVYRNDVEFKLLDNALKRLKPHLIVLSSGPGHPEDAGISVDVIRTYQGSIPIFGVGLGMQCIIEAFEGEVSKGAIVQGKNVHIKHDGKSIFKSIHNPFLAGRYNSLHAADVPYEFEVSARDEHEMVMAIRHKEVAVEGVQFHPSSLLTPDGSQLIDAVLKEASKK